MIMNAPSLDTLYVTYVSSLFLNVPGPAMSSAANLVGPAELRRQGE